MLTIRLTADAETGEGVEFNADYDAFFEGFEPYAYPLFLPEEGETTQIVHLETPETGEEAESRAVLVEGQDFDYTFSNHSVSGTIETVRLVRLGDAYDTETEDLVYDEDGLVSDATPIITISGLGIYNEAGVKGDVHEIIKGFMGGGHDGTSIAPDAFSAHLFAEGHKLLGSSGDDVYVGTKYADVVKGAGGSDELKGAKGNDKIYGGDGRDAVFGQAGADALFGGAGRDKLVGGTGTDKLTGGKGTDTFVFRSVAEANKDKITDFSAGDRINLRGIDADSGAKGNQAFDFISTDDFSGSAGELRVVEQGDRLVLKGDVDGNGRLDFRLVLLDAETVDAGDFLL
ncbi:calcium-binding protein [Tropicimonas marinistellae]|uniref:calcium-binding protein n=1 Tax=Tropicimonas marinistellae TaxID=1739787 RepID=UPI00082DFE6B|nr:hypothetical protein [Tropicimonas marinistellae]